MKVGIEALNIYCGSAALDVETLARARNLNMDRFENLLMKQKTVPMPYEDPISNGVNAAKPIVDALSEKERDSIDMVITCTESGIDFGKSISTYVHHHLGLSRNCRLFELKNACYSGTAGFQMAINFVLSGTAPGKKVLVVCTDIMRVHNVENSMESSFTEPSSGSGAVAMLVSDNPVIFEIDKGASGYYGYEVMDTCRPVPDMEAGDSDLSLLSYLDCCEGSFKQYQNRVSGTDYESTFSYMAFHTPFGGMVKGAHRSNMRKFKKSKPDYIELDFKKRVKPSLNFCERVGNIMGATVYLAMASMITYGDFTQPRRVGIFSYGSGCCSEFYSGIVRSTAQEKLKKYQLPQHLDHRYMLSMEEYEGTFQDNESLKFGIRNHKVDPEKYKGSYQYVKGQDRLVLTAIENFHRKYEFV